jgi:hypothetical protein
MLDASADFVNPGKTGPVKMRIEYDGECIPCKDQTLLTPG